MDEETFHTPAALLRAIRDAGRIDVAELGGGAERGWSTQRAAEARDFSRALRDLEEAGLIHLEHEGGVLSELLMDAVLGTRERQGARCYARPSERLESLQIALGLSLTWLHERELAERDPLAGSIRRVHRLCRVAAIDDQYRDALEMSLRELRTCLVEQLHVAALCLCGKILEIALKQRLSDLGATGYERLSLFDLIQELYDKRSDRGFVTFELKEIAEIIRKSRNPAVHHIEKVPVPSRENARTAINATLDVVNRILLDGRL